MIQLNIMVDFDTIFQIGDSLVNAIELWNSNK